MRMLSIVSLFCFSVYSQAGGFDNLYFEFSAKKCEVAGEVFSADNKKLGTVTGKTSGEVSEDGESYTERMEYVYMPQEHQAKETMVWKRDGDGVFSSSGKDAADVKFACVMTIKSEKEYVTVATFEDGRTVETKAKLKEDGVIHAVDTAKTKEGDVVFIIKYTRTKAMDQVKP